MHGRQPTILFLQKLSLYCGEVRGEKKNQTGLSSKKTQCFNYWRAMGIIYNCHLVSELKDSAQALCPSHGGQNLVFLIKKMLKTFCRALQLALACVRVRKGLLCISFVSKWDSHHFFPHCSHTSFT